ncbi:MAG: 30S ribosomal protein S8 [Candidatus Yonathbacteria bacterium CG_4_10_14_3_um_filter_47_65]|uniref:Small ribosomal subunit protein uS8 n=2 Tax=Parcubacteria group TaxID=1794811 RepID=A0A2M8D5R8_9BACT|nr:MAG: 30S ribosomal protein S8 [Candidatus Nomurabacteria bacterium CG1_02_47_685]PIP03940.1 MAG: 30S ribosomal protein S8 [Candidatus Yonathbacteria bacterium CG23_combo_of_CG06-09_8_20_14_all_46_18]PIQ32355.1 MAG: 30S ribosomal protein S8 [Candidatus Yonathbacteria bacterium CG17_big_fil_post_rev_8_21_14_2_50_46_19]PIX56292.1 MAG: 30S ribosomal protein S8 [Candidatus Yonathbacteria bacterium CG_4_10_14_3_um_filter_47_65]PIY57915.1 MAG: 30S ribosomal protein S8 [Candidatus Yonathbacteria bac
MNDKIADMVIRIKNAGDAGHETVVVPYSKLRFAIASLLLKNGYISSVMKKGKKVKRSMELGISYEEGKARVRGVKRISKLSARKYYGVGDIKPVKGGYGKLVLSTPKGILTGEEAKKEHVGGEALFQVW